MKMIKKCLYCKKTFKTNKIKQKFCSKICRFNFKKWENLKKSSEKIKGVENKDYVICRLCNYKVKMISGNHLKAYHSIILLINIKKNLKIAQ